MRRTARWLGPPVLVAALCAGGGTASAASVLTFEGAFSGSDRSSHQIMGGALCAAPSTCQGVPYTSIPLGTYTQEGGRMLTAAIPASGDVTLLGHSQGGQVIYSALRDWSTGAQDAPSPASRVTWFSFGNPENRYGGRQGGVGYTNGQGLPEDPGYSGYEVIRQYDGWADAPDDRSNLLAVLNAEMGKYSLHSNYRDIDYANVVNGGYPTHTDTYESGAQVRYVWVPTDTLPLIAWTGPFAPALDNALRPIVEKAYNRPVSIPDPTPPAEPNTAELDGQPGAKTESRAAALQDIPRSTLQKRLAAHAAQAGERQQERAAARAEKVRTAMRSVRDRITKANREFRRLPPERTTETSEKS